MYSTTSLRSTNSTLAFSGSIEDSPLSGKSKSIDAGSRFGRIIVKAPNAVSQLTLAKANQEIDELPTFDFENRGNKIRQVKFIALDKCNYPRFPSKVTFDADGKLSDTENFEKNFEPNTDSIKAMCKEALQEMGRKLNWKNFSVEVRCGVIRYPLTPENAHVRNMPWHKDGSNLSMTTLLSPYKQNGSGFTGGELSFAKESEVFDRVPLEETIKTLEYEKPGDGVIFDGVKTLHKVENIHLLQEKKVTEKPVERRLLICFVETSIRHVIDLSAALGEENLVHRENPRPMDVVMNGWLRLP